MRTADILRILLHERPNGVSFDNMALRLLRQIVEFPDRQIEELKDIMFQLGDGLWFSLDMIADDDTRSDLQKQVASWLAETSCFSVDLLYDGFCGVLRHVSNPEHFAIFLQKLGFSVAEYGKGGFYCFKSTSTLGECLMSVSQKMNALLKDEGGVLAVSEIEEALPHLTSTALECIRKEFLTEIHTTEVRGVPYWRRSEAVPLPEDFEDKLTEAVDTLVEIGKKVNTGNLEFALDLFYRVHFREEYGLTNSRVFISTCAKHYKGTLGNKQSYSRDFISDWINYNKKIFDWNATDPHRVNEVLSKRSRRPNTRFDKLGVPIGAKLVFANDRSKVCTVLDGSNQVEFDGEPWAISTLAQHLLNASTANGFKHFCFDEESLWNRRLRLASEDGGSMGSPQSSDEAGKVKELVTNENESSGERFANCGEEAWSEWIVSEHGGSNANRQSEVQRSTMVNVEEQIIGLEGRPLKPETWRTFKSAGIDPRVAEWVQRVETGDRIEHVASEANYAVSTMKNMISNFKLYFKVCELNNITPEGGADV